MKVAIITSTFNTRSAWLDQCHNSVLKQTYPCTHFIVNDGGERTDVERHSETARIVHIPGPHADGGNAGRATGGILALCEGYDAITYLDSDNWYEPNHIESLMDLAAFKGASVISSSRLLYTPNDELLGECYETDPNVFIDCSCMLFTKDALGAIAYWACVPEPIKLQSDRYVWNRIIKDQRLQRAHSKLTTVNFRTVYKCHYRYFLGAVPDYATK